MRVDDETACDAGLRVAVDVGGYRMEWVGYAQAGRRAHHRAMAHAGRGPGT